ncbi:NFX1-type zinc finger-containing protein 1 [Homalodisca vitripennis]|nr:NFX1-type zinc finger-containing protein 1 [Homalodisca vitripennis]
MIVTVLIEEAAKVLEAHIITALGSHCEHVILFGDHAQLRPTPEVQKLSDDYNFDISLFERMVNNGLFCYRLNVQNQMRPEFSSLITPTFYDDLTNHSSTENRPNILGVDKNLYFIKHKENENQTYKKKTESDSQSLNGTDVELNELREAMIEQLVDEPNNLTTADINALLEGAEEEWEDVIITDILTNIDKEGGEEGEDSSTPVATHTVNMDMALCAFATAVTWAEEKGASASDILTLKRMQENVFKLSIISKKQKSITNYVTVVELHQSPISRLFEPLPVPHDEDEGLDFEGL